MYTGTYEDELIAACQRMGYGLDLNFLREKVTVNTGSGHRKDDRVFKNAAVAMAWVEQQERQRSQRLADFCREYGESSKQGGQHVGQQYP